MASSTMSFSKAIEKDSESPTGHRYPVLWSRTMEALPGASAQTAGRPEAIASSVTFPKVSVWLGKKKTSLEAYAAARSAP